LTLTLSCTMDLLNYPFDKQKCHVALMSFAYSDTDIEFKWINTSEAQSMQMFGNSEPIVWNDAVILPQFEVKKIFPGSCERRYHQKSGNHSCIQAGIHLTRNVGFYIVQMYIPSMLIVMLSWISFWLNSNSVPGRVSLGLLTVLTMTTQSSSVNAALPRVSYTKAIDVWMSTCLVFVFAALLEFAVVNVLSRKESIRGFSFRNMFAIPKDDEKEEGPPAMCEMTVPLDGFKDPDTQKKRRFPKKGIVYAVYVDVMARFFFPVCFILFIIVYWCVYGSQVDD
ncbi:gamma-aminobutyric acid-grated chloride-ion channel/receptor, zeta subunit, partial [Biomphalaria glabrata]